MDTTVFPTKGNLIASKNSHKLSKLGFDLLDKKRVILINELMKYVSDAEKMRMEVDILFKEAYLSLQKSNIILGISNISAIAMATPIDDKVKLKEKSIMGVNVPVIQYENVANVSPNYGILGTDDSLDDAFCKFAEIKGKIIKLAELEASVYKLAAGVKKTTKRANALKNIMIPKFEVQIKTITDVLDEKEREEFSRLKIIKKN